MDTLIFDMDDTLVVEEASAEAALMATCKFASNRVSAGSWEGLWAEFSGDDKNLHILADWAPTYRLGSWQEALRRCGVHQDGNGLAKELADRFVKERRKLHVVYDDAVPVLEQLRKYYRLGLLTNGAPDLQRRKLRGSGLTGYFYAIVISGEVGFGKPDPRIFKLILERLDAKADSCAMIGNSLKSDIAPALELGILAVWINRGHNIGAQSIVPDSTIDRLTELTKIFEQKH